MNNINVLDLKFYCNDLSKEVSIREFFYELMYRLWNEQDGFSGKRPFGNSDWDADLINCLILNQLIPGKIDENGYVEDYNSLEANTYVIKNILKPLFGVI